MSIGKASITLPGTKITKTLNIYWWVNLTDSPMMGVVPGVLSWSPNKPSDVEVIAYKACRTKNETDHEGDDMRRLVSHR